MAASTKSTLLGVNLFSFKDTIFNQKPAVAVTPQTTTPKPTSLNSKNASTRTRQRSSTVSRPADGGYDGTATRTQPDPKANRKSLLRSSTVSIASSGPASERKDSKVMDASIRSITDKTRRVQRSHSTASSMGRPKMTVNNFLQPSPTSNTKYDPEVVVSTVVGDRRSLIDGLLSRSYATPETSRSTSPSSRDDRSKDDGGVSTPASSISLSDKSSTKEGGEEKTPGKRGRGLTNSDSKRGRRPLSMMFTRNTVSEPTVPTVSGAPPLVYANTTLEPPSIPQPNPNTLKRPRDELSEGFKMLESEYTKFQSKTGLQKANILRTSLISFLRRHHDRASAGVTYDELDKRIRCLHRWWTGLLAQLKNRSAGAIAGADRTVYLEGVVGIMSRPEWRPPQSEFAPTCQEVVESRNASSASLASTASHYSVRKSVHHNIKTLFTRTLMETFAFATDKMGQPTTPGTMVAFSGKVMAYAFFFCQEVSEMMLALWNVQPQTVRRVVHAYQSDRATDFHGLSEYVLGSFPQHLRKLGFTGLTKFLRELKAQKRPPIGTNVDWSGPWIPRWCGKDTDLLFVFFRHYHLLLADYLLPSASNNARLCAPGFVQVMAQMLSIFDDSLNRKPVTTPSSRELPGASTITFDDVLADASLTATVQVPNRNAAKPMADNKLVILLRDIVYQKTPASEACNDEHISTLILALHTSTRNLKMYDTDASITLCDLLEEVIPLLLRAEKKSPLRSKYVDWDFWLTVWKKMLDSNNTMTELRTICLLYSFWGLIRQDDELKKMIALDWLLSEEVWDKYFTHWCPMVRAYFLRFLCWRVARLDAQEDVNETDGLIYQLLSLRLRASYGHHIYLREKAENNGTGIPSSQPCLPAPGRRLIILRNDVDGQGNPQILTENKVPTVLPTLVTTNATRTRSSSSISGLSDDELAELNGSLTSSKPAETVGNSLRKRFSFIRSWGLGGSTTPEKESSPPRTPEAPAKVQPPKVTPPAAAVSTCPQATFKFSLEWWNQPLLGIPNRVPTRLPNPSQTYIEAKFGQQSNYIAISESPEVVTKHNWKYAGRALAEWNAVVVELENFYDRRKNEGRLTLADIETPTLGMEGLKKL